MMIKKNQFKKFKKNIIDIIWVLFLKINQNLFSFIFLMILTRKVSQEYVGEFFIVLAATLPL